MALPPEVELGLEVIKVLGIFGGGAIILLRIGRMAGKFEASADKQREEISEIKLNMRMLSDTVTTVAVQKNEISNIHEDLTRLTRWYEELRRGKGLVTEKS